MPGDKIKPPSSSVNQYTPEEQAQIDELLRGAIKAEELYGADELERYAEEQRRAKRG